MPPDRLRRLAHEPRFTDPILPVTTPTAKDIGDATSDLGWSHRSWGFAAAATGTPVTAYGALAIATAWACVKRLGEDIGKLPRTVKRRLPKGGMRVDLRHPLNRLLRRPNRWQTPSQLWGYMAVWLALRGNCYAVVLRGTAGEPTDIVPVSPDRVAVLLSERGEVYYEFNHPLLPPGIRLHRDNVIHVRNVISFDGYTGASPIAAAQDVFGLGIATQQHGATLFRQGAQINGIIRHPAKLTRDAKDYLSEAFGQRYAGLGNAHKTPVLDEGMSFEKQTMTNEDAQFLQSRQFTVPEICRMFGVPPHKVQDYTNAHFRNMAEGNLAYRGDCLQPIGTQFEEECARVLLFEDEQDDYVIALDYDELLRADRKTRYETDEIGIRSGRLSPNEARIGDGMEPNVPGGDEFQKPLNMGSTRDGPQPADDTAGPPEDQA